MGPGKSGVKEGKPLAVFLADCPSVSKSVNGDGFVGGKAKAPSVQTTACAHQSRTRSQEPR